MSIQQDANTWTSKHVDKTKVITKFFERWENYRHGYLPLSIDFYAKLKCQCIQSDHQMHMDVSQLKLETWAFMT